MKAKRESHQEGSVVLKKRAKGPDVWVLRYTETDEKGHASRKSVIIADKKQCPTKAAAEKAAQSKRATLNEPKGKVSMKTLIARYEKEAIPGRQSTSPSYRSLLKRIDEQWGDFTLEQMATSIMEIERWMRGLKTIPRNRTTNQRIPDWKLAARKTGEPPRPLSRKTLSNLKAMLHRIFQCAMRWNYIQAQANPMALVEIQGIGTAGKSRKRRVLTMKQYEALLDDKKLSDHVKVMIQVAMSTGMRGSEFLGLRWDDINLSQGTIFIQRAVVGRHEDATKSEESEAVIPIHQSVVDLLQAWKESAPPIEGWVFGSPITKRPFHLKGLLEDHLQPAAKRCGLPGIGWHDFRHTYRAMLADMELPLEVQQMMMRHRHIQTTLHYGKSPENRLKKTRGANAKLVEMLPAKRRA